jgi:hypothetical protein
LFKDAGNFHSSGISSKMIVPRIRINQLVEQVGEKNRGLTGLYEVIYHEFSRENTTLKKDQVLFI